MRTKHSDAADTKRRIGRRRSIIYRYILSYATIALLSCVSIWIFMFSQAQKEINAYYISIQEEKLKTVAELLDENYGLMQDMAFYVRTSLYFKPSYLKQNIYNPSVMLEHLQRYENTVPMSSDYFLLYHDANIVYSVGRTETSASDYFKTFATYRLRTADTEELYRQINGEDDFTIISLPGISAEAFVFRLNFSGNSSDSAALCFILYEEKLEQVIRASVGEFAGSLEISAGGRKLFGPQEVRQADTETLLLTQSKKHEFTLTFVPDNRYLSMVLGRLNLASMVGLGITALMIMLAIYAAWLNYKPIKKIAGKFMIRLGDTQGDELSKLSLIFAELAEQNKVHVKELADDMEQLRQMQDTINAQMVQLVICGRYDAQDCHMRNWLRSINEERAFEYYGVLTVQQINAAQGNGPELSEDMPLTVIEGISDNSIAFHGVKLPNSEITAFLCLCRETGDMDRAREAAHSACAKQGIDICCGAGTAREIIASVPISFIEALSDLQEASRLESSQHAQSRRKQENRLYNKEIEGLIEQLKGAVESGDVRRSSEILRRISEASDSDGTYLTKFNAYTSSIKALLVIADKTGLQIIDEKYHFVGMLQNSESFCALGLELVERIRARLVQLSELEEDEQWQKLSGYMRSSISKYDMDISKLSDELGIQERNVSQIIRKKVGLSYKEFLNRLRIEAAKDLLAGGLSVKETAEQVGLTDVSYFIRIFKGAVGETPANYKRTQLDSK